MLAAAFRIAVLLAAITTTIPPWNVRFDVVDQAGSSDALITVVSFTEEALSPALVAGTFRSWGYDPPAHVRTIKQARDSLVVIPRIGVSEACIYGSWSTQILPFPPPREPPARLRVSRQRFSDERVQELVRSTKTRRDAADVLRKE